MRDDLVAGLVGGVSMQANDQVEVPLVRIGFSFFPHVVARRFAKVETTHRHLSDTFAPQLNPGTGSVLA